MAGVQEPVLRWSIDASPLPAGVGEGEAKFMHATVVGRQVVMAPGSAGRFLLFDPSAGGRDAMIEVPVPPRVEGDRCPGASFSRVAAVGGHAVAVPLEATQFLTLDVTRPGAVPVEAHVPPPALDAASYPDGYGPLRYAYAAVTAGRIVAVPYDADCFVTFSVAAAGVAGVAAMTPVPPPMRGVRRKFNNAVVARGKVVAIPCRADRFLILDPTDPAGRVEGVPLPRGSFEFEDAPRIGGEPNFNFNAFEAAAIVGSKVVAVPCDGDRFVILDVDRPAAGLVEVPLPPDAGAVLWVRKFRHAVAVGGKVVAIPCNASPFLILDPDRPAAPLVEVPLPPYFTGRNAKFCHASVVGGLVVAVPFFGDRFVVIDPARPSRPPVEVRLPAGITGAAMFRYAATAGDAVVGVPAGSSHVVTLVLSDGGCRRAAALLLHCCSSGRRAPCAELPVDLVKKVAGFLPLVGAVA